MCLFVCILDVYNLKVVTNKDTINDIEYHFIFSPKEDGIQKAIVWLVRREQAKGKL